MTNHTAAIVGAGLVGSLWAIVLKNFGFQVDVFEKRADIRQLKPSENRSINLVITSRGIDALTRAGVYQKAYELSVPVYGRMMHSREGQTVFQPYGKKSEFNLSISRLDLNRMLISSAEEAGAQFHFSEDIQKIDFARHEIDMISGQNRKKTKYDVLFGTDGAGSSVRKALIELNSEEYKESGEWLHLEYIELHIPPAPNGSPQLDKNALHIWPRGHHMMMALANRDGSFTVTLYMPPNNSPESFAEIQTTERVQAFFEKYYADAIQLIPNFQSEFLARRPGRLGTVRLSKWNLDNSVALLGDSAHAIVPFFGQGMNLGFEDVSRLSENWLKNSEFDFADYSKAQKPNADAIATMAIENWHEMSKKVAQPEFLMRKKIEAQLELNFPEHYKSRYGMVTYTLIPFSTIQEIGTLQSQILEQLQSGLERIEDLDLSLAQTLIEKNLLPVYKKLNVPSFTENSF